MKHVALELGHLLGVERLFFSEAVKSAEQVSETVTQFPVCIGRAGEHFLADADVLEIVGRRDPHAQDVGARLLDDLQWIHDVADRL